jgi:hypothetical protein
MLKLGLDIGDRIDLVSLTGDSECVTITLDQTRDLGARLVVRDRDGNGITAWLDVADSIHLDGYFDGPARVELDKRTKRGAKLFFNVPRSVRINRVRLRDQHETATPTGEPAPVGSTRVASALQAAQEAGAAALDATVIGGEGVLA